MYDNAGPPLRVTPVNTLAYLRGGSPDPRRPAPARPEDRDAGAYTGGAGRGSAPTRRHGRYPVRYGNINPSSIDLGSVPKIVCSYRAGIIFGYRLSAQIVKISYVSGLGIEDTLKNIIIFLIIFIIIFSHNYAVFIGSVRNSPVIVKIHNIAVRRRTKP